MLVSVCPDPAKGDPAATCLLLSTCFTTCSHLSAYLAHLPPCPTYSAACLPCPPCSPACLSVSHKVQPTLVKPSHQGKLHCSVKQFFLSTSKSAMVNNVKLFIVLKLMV